MTRSVRNIEEGCCYLERELERYITKENITRHRTMVFDEVHDMSREEGFSVKGPRFKAQYMLALELT
tara:strand:- start:268 stop:468 length:201 start_codon:yes stop_codon:yes gene_type:complete